MINPMIDEKGINWIEAPAPKKTLLQRLGLVSVPSLYSTYALGRDLSHYDLVTLKDLEGYDFIIAKIMGCESQGGAYLDEKWNYHAQLAWDLPSPLSTPENPLFGVPLIGYVFSNPRVFLEIPMTPENLANCSNEAHPVMQILIPALHAGSGWKQVLELYFDYEAPSYWIDAPYTVDDYWMRLFHLDVIARLKKIKRDDPSFPLKKVGMYSRRNFVEVHDLNDFSIQRYLIGDPTIEIWAAGYPRKVPNNIGVAEIRANWLPLDTWMPAPFGWSKDRAMPVRYWQFNGEPDLNLYMGTVAKLYAELGFMPHEAAVIPVPVPSSLKGTVLSSIGVKIRKGPGTGFDQLGSCPKDFQVDIFETKQDGIYTWRRINRNMWMCSRQGTLDLMKIE